ncbi:hypothetical protein T11_2494 [Trichinella zimbabwensis]|uniref:Uncharacterized protein n=1 Tax=Trichinella zimbabwensis TaxID=268475 RepID=A0A0V1GB90_9BILA|nr:hypothetical protein T11_2494 [Trichinella zimbabwensis]
MQIVSHEAYEKNQNEMKHRMQETEKFDVNFRL